MEKSCPRCGRTFECLNNEIARCHCASVTLNTEQLEYISRNFKGCLCQDCLQEISLQKHPVSVRELSNFLLDFSRTLMGAGVHTSRVVRNITRIAESFGYKVDMTIFQMHITMTLRDRNDDTIRRTSVGKILPAPFNFNIISQLSSLSWAAHDDHLSFGELTERYQAILHQPRISRWWVLGLVAVANSSFCHLFGGDLIAMGLVALATLVGFFLRQQMNTHKFNHMAITFICSFVASLIAACGIWFHLGTTPQIALGSSVLFLIPGVPLINSIIDLLEGHVLVGISRGVNACILIVCIAMGLSATLVLLGLDTL